MRIVLCYPVEQRHLDQIAAAAPGHEIVNAGDARIAEELLEADIFCGHAKVPVPWDEVVRRGRLRWIQSSAAGLDHCLVPSVIDSGIEVSSASGLFADQVAEQTLALWLGLLRGLPTYFRAQRKKEFIRHPTGDLHRGTVGIVGFGGNGRRLAEVIAPMRVRILATDMFPDPKPDYVESLWYADRLREMAAQVDTLVLCIPLNSQTEGLIDRSLIARMRPGSLLINVARGPVVDEDAIVDALHSGHLAGYGTDVTAVEPLPESSPLWDQTNIIITPHVGAQSASRYDDATNLVCENLSRYMAGKRPRNLVDKHLGYPTPEARGITDSWEE